MRLHFLSRTIYLLLNGTLYPVANPDTVEALGFASINDVQYTKSIYTSELNVSADTIDMYNPKCNVTHLKVEAAYARSLPVPPSTLESWNVSGFRSYDEHSHSLWDIDQVNESCPVYYTCDLEVGGLGDRLEHYIFCLNVAKLFEATLLFDAHFSEGKHAEFVEYKDIMVYRSYRSHRLQCSLSIFFFLFLFFFFFMHTTSLL